MTIHSTLGAVALHLLLAMNVPHGASTDSCPTADEGRHEAVATASLWANVLARPTSIRTESARLLREAQAEAASVRPPAGLCPDGCAAPRTPEIVFRSTPRKVRVGYRGEAYCESKRVATTSEPLVYDRNFASTADLEGWIQDLAMGDGPDGKHLYEHCDNSCSPRYTYVIRNEDDGLLVRTSVICGHARDRDDNKFDLSYSLRWSCSLPGPEHAASR